MVPGLLYPSGVLAGIVIVAAISLIFFWTRLLRAGNLSRPSAGDGYAKALL
jgi:hypothetical protein